MVKHATADLPAPARTLCGELLLQRHPDLGLVPRVWPALKIDNADPDCKRCLRSIARAIRMNREPVE